MTLISKDPKQPILLEKKANISSGVPGPPRVRRSWGRPRYGLAPLGIGRGQRLALITETTASDPVATDTRPPTPRAPEPLTGQPLVADPPVPAPQEAAPASDRRATRATEMYQDLGHVLRVERMNPCRKRVVGSVGPVAVTERKRRRDPIGGPR
jgi:hypothetical protein